jgi:predicted nucleotidyltransferase
MRNESVENLIAVTRKLLETKYPGAEFAFLAGSIIRGEGTKYSDLDIVVIFEDLPNAFRESFYFEDFPVETFVHTPETLNYFFESDRIEQNPSLAMMVAEGLVVPTENDLSEKLKCLAAEVVEDPPKITSEEIDRLRYGITNLLDDIRDPRSKETLIGAATGLYPSLAEFYLRTNGHWSARQKAIPKYLREAGPEFGERFCEGFEDLFGLGKTDKIIKLAEELLEPFGGLYFDGLKLDAPSGWRKPIK